MKYKEPVKGKGFRKLFKNAGYNIYLVDEFRTSCRLFIDGAEMIKFKKRENPRSWIRGKNGTKLIIKQHGLLRTRCTPNNKSVDVLVNRDFNGSMNIRQIAYNALNNIDRPIWLRRDNQETTINKKPKKSTKTTKK